MSKPRLTFIELAGILAMLGCLTGCPPRMEFERPDTAMVLDADHDPALRKLIDAVYAAQTQADYDAAKAALAKYWGAR